MMPGYSVIANKKSVPAETRTLGPLIKSQLLYQLSYGDNHFRFINIKQITKNTEELWSKQRVLKKFVQSLLILL
jgi:hypothetical protein